MKTYKEFVAEAKSQIREVSADEAQRLHESGGVTFVDVREPSEVNLGKIPGAVHVPRGTLERDIEGVVTRDKQIVVYCMGGSRSAMAAARLQEMGYDNVVSLTGGFRAWAESGGEIED